jgi:hypothetical protein
MEESAYPAAAAAAGPAVNAAQGLWTPSHL